MEYKAFRIGALFEKLNAPYIGAGRKQDNVSKERTEEFSLPLINCKWGDNGIMYYGRPSDFVHYENVLSVVYNGPPTGWHGLCTAADWSFHRRLFDSTQKICNAAYVDGAVSLS